MLVLFTSYRMCHLTARTLAGAALAGPLLVQGEGCGREALSERFRKEPGAVLLGVASFWEGVDFPGPQLEILVIPKIPFPVPSDPLVEARTEMIRRMGQNPFTGLFLPEAILRLRQGIGRLIRGRGDRGIIVILDSRIQVKSYGRVIIDSLPFEPVPVFSGREVLEESDRFFTESGGNGGVHGRGSG
jgi:ATP-dependent DNA helicase DinG